MLKIRLQRVGRKHDPSFRVVLTDSRNATQSGKFLEVLGFYDARKGVPHFSGEKIVSWIGQGAQLSDTVNNLLIKHAVIKGTKRNVVARRFVRAGDMAPVKADVVG